MDKEFDFDRIGKKVPYRTPEHFFEEMQQEVMQPRMAHSPCNIGRRCTVGID